MQMDRARRITPAIALAAALALACAGQPEAEPPAADPGLAGFGQTLFLDNCAACHGVEGRGDGPVAPSLLTPPADLTQIAARRGGEFPAAEVARVIDGRFEIAPHGTREMPVWGTRFGEGIADRETAEELTRGRLDVLVAYLRSIQHPAP